MAVIMGASSAKRSAVIICANVVCNNPLKKASSATQVNKRFIAIKASQKLGALGLKSTSPVIKAIEIVAKRVAMMIKINTIGIT